MHAACCKLAGIVRCTHACTGCLYPTPMPPTGVAVSSDGINWRRGSGRIEGSRGPQRSLDVGKVLEPNGDWWWFDTCHMNVADVQILSSSSVSGGTGVYWMFYSGGSFEPVSLPAGMSQARGGWGVCVAPFARAWRVVGWNRLEEAPCLPFASELRVCLPPLTAMPCSRSTFAPRHALPGPHPPAGQPGRRGRRPGGPAPAPRPGHEPGRPQLGSHRGGAPHGGAV